MEISTITLTALELKKYISNMSSVTHDKLSWTNADAELMTKIAKIVFVPTRLAIQ